jgi:uncharacterized protein YqfB (UPF0267 family)
MGALNFMARFADDVESGKKPTTIRVYRKDGRDPKPGDILKLFTGQRSKNKCRKLGEGVCTKAQHILINIHGRVRLDGVWLSKRRMEKMAKRDGLDCYAELHSLLAEIHGLPLRGLLIEWRLVRQLHIEE